VLTAAYTIVRGPVVDGQSYTVGDTGPGGGKIFYVKSGGFSRPASGGDSTNCHYLEADLATDWLMWASTGNGSRNITTYSEIGRGWINTQNILTQDASAPAASYCRGLTTGGKNDWYLPSLDELLALYNARNAVGDFETPPHWSSTQGTPVSNVRTVRFGNSSSMEIISKTVSSSTRAIRAF
jgi:hypothetical protein